MIPYAQAFAAAIKVSSGIPAAPTISAVRPVSGQQTFWNITNGGTTFSNNLSVMGTSPYTGATIGLYLDGVLQGTTAVLANGSWLYPLGILSDAAHSVTATVTVNSVTSPMSSSLGFTITPPITSFTNVVWGFMNVDNVNYGLFAAGGAGNPCPSYSFQELDPHTLRFEVHQGDRAPGDSNDERSEIGQPGPGTGAWQLNNRPLRFTHEFMVEAGGPNLASGWFIIYQIHNDDATAGTGTSPYFSLLLCGPSNTQSPGDHLGVQYRWWNSSRGALSQSSVVVVDAYISPAVITRGVYHTIDVNAFVNNAGAGILQVWIDGVQVINLNNINLGYGFRSYTEYGIYRGHSSSDVEAVRDRNMLLSLATV
jgi:Polysaccharide lyase